MLIVQISAQVCVVLSSKLEVCCEVTAYTVRPWIFLRLSTALNSCQNILSEKEQWTFLWCQEVLLSLKDRLSRVVANYLVLEV